jgi:hypothetical protein
MSTFTVDLTYHACANVMVIAWYAKGVKFLLYRRQLCAFHIGAVITSVCGLPDMVNSLRDTRGLGEMPIVQLAGRSAYHAMLGQRASLNDCQTNRDGGETSANLPWKEMKGFKEHNESGFDLLTCCVE